MDYRAHRRALDEIDGIGFVLGRRIMPSILNRRDWRSFALAAMVALAPVTAFAQGFSAADSAAMKAYVLDAGKMNRFVTALTSLAAAKKSNAALAAEFEMMEEEEGDTLTAMKAKITRHPRIFAYFQNQGLTVDDAVLLPLTAVSAGAAVAVNGDAGFATVVSPAQMNFVRGNAALMERFSAANEALEGGDSDDNEP